MKVLLTGSQGFTGPYVRAALEQAGHGVIGTVLERAAQEELAPGEVQLDMVDRDACRRVIDAHRPDAIVHLAGIAFASETSVEPYYRINVIGTENLLRACTDVGHVPRKIVLASSSMVYGTPEPGQVELDELSPLKPTNHYAISKVAMEFMARTYYDRLPLLIARPFNYIGCGQANYFVTAKIVDHFKRKATSIELGNVDVARDFPDVRDIAQTYCKLVEDDATSDVVNICSGRTYSLRYVLDTLTKLTGQSMQVNVNPAFVRLNDPKLVRGSVTHLESLVGECRPREFDSTLEWMLDTSAPSRINPTALDIAA